MKKQQLLLGAVGIALSVAAGLWYTSRPAVAPANSVDVLVRVGEATMHAITVPVGTTALSATEQIAEVKTRSEGNEPLVTAIDGVVADADHQQFWKFVINGQAASVNAGSYVVQPRDTIHWMLATY